MTTSSPELTTRKAGPPAHVEHKVHATKEAVNAMSFPADPAEAGSTSSDPAALRRDIEEVRGDLAKPVDASAAKADVKSRVQDTVHELNAQATHTAQAMRAQAMVKVPQLTETAQQRAQQAQRVVQDKSGAAVGAVLAALVLLTLRRRSRRRQNDQKAQPARGRSRTSRSRRGMRVLAVLGSLARRHRRVREENS